MLATQVLPEDTVDNVSQDESEIVGHLVIEGKRYEIRKGENKIGRDPLCSVVLENCTISKLHAIIESYGRDETFIYDCGSTNSSKLKKAKLRPYCRYKLDDKSDIVFGNAVATFELAPKINFTEVKTSEPSSVNTQVLDELDDIFDLSTQVTIPKPSTSKDIIEPRNNFKIPNSIISDKKQPAPRDSNSDSGFSGLENSEIFDLSTQCQLPKLNHEQTNNDSDKIKSLLNDGQDEVLCNFMLMRSPGCSDETEIDIFDVPTQIDVVDGSVNEKDARMERSISEVTAVLEDGPIDTQNVTKVEIGGEEDEEVLTQRFELLENEDNKSVDEEDDEIFTQKFELSENEGNKSILEIREDDQMEDSTIKKVDEITEDDADKKGDETFESTENDSDSATQIYEAGLVEFSERIESMLSNRFKQSETKPAEDSGDETASDLEVDDEKIPAIDQLIQPKTPEMKASQNSNDSYTFEVCPESSETIEGVEPAKEVDNRVAAQTPPRNVQVNIPTERRSPSPECWGPLSLEMPCTQDLKYTIDKFLGRENQVGNEQSNSPLKRNRNSNGSIDASPAKKQKPDKKLSKSWQVHDVAQILPTRTRNSVRTPVTNKQSCRRSTRTRKSNSDISPHLIRCRNNKKESPVETPKVLPSHKVELLKTSSRKRKTKTETPTIAFTGFKSDNQEKIMRELGGEKTDDLSLASVVVADKVRRTVKFLCAIGLSIPITSPRWLTSSKRERKFVNPVNFILKDEEAEDKWQFDLRSSLERSRKIKLLEGYNVYATKSTKPPVEDLFAIVKCCGGTPIVHRPNTWPRQTIIVSCEEDKEMWPSPKVRNIKLVHFEFILTGVLRQKLDFKSYSLR